MRYAAILLLLGCVTKPIPQHLDWPIVAYPLNETTLNRPDVIGAFDVLLRRAAYGHLGEERAGFLVLEGDRFRLVPWPPSHKFHAEEWSGKIPNGTVAVVHTHPPSQPQPSTHDRTEAQRVGIPILVITATSVVLARDDGGAVLALHILAPDETTLAHSSHSW